MIEKIVFSKVCKCGNHMQIAVRKHDDGSIEAECLPTTGLTESCWMVGDSTAECTVCQKRTRSYHHAYTVEARTWKER